MQKPKILITNDDGIHAPGIFHLWKSVSEHTQTTIIAPEKEKSGAGMSTTLTRPLEIHPVKWLDETKAWKVNGTPTDCVKLALSVLKEQPDLIISGINRGANSGRNVLYSGTIGGIIEGVFRGIPGIAFSCIEMLDPDYAITEKYIFPIIEFFLKNPMPKGTFLNVSFPTTHKEGIKGIKMTHQGSSYWQEKPDQRIHPHGHFYYWMGARWMDHEEIETSDVCLHQQGYITVTPIHIDQLTDQKFLQEIKDPFEKSFEEAILT
jgi:5'-nucleotidase